MTFLDGGIRCIEFLCSFTAAETLTDVPAEHSQERIVWILNFDGQTELKTTISTGKACEYLKKIKPKL